MNMNKNEFNRFARRALYPGLYVSKRKLCEEKDFSSEISKYAGELAAYVTEEPLGEFQSRETHSVVIYDPQTLLEGINSGELDLTKSDISFIVNSVIVGMVSVVEPFDYYGNCADAREVALSAGPGYGKQVYGAAYAIASRKSKSGMLMSDRNTVSPAARRGWRNAYSSTRKKVELDDGTKTPDDSWDDCQLYSNIDPDSPALNHAYKPEGWEDGMLSKMESVHSKVIKTIEEFSKEYSGEEYAINNQSAETNVKSVRSLMRKAAKRFFQSQQK